MSDPIVTIAGKAGTVRVQPGPNVPTISDGYGGWTEVTRPRRMAMTEWTGVAPKKATIQLLFDKLDTDGSVQSDVSAALKVVTVENGTKEPPTFKVSNAWPIPSTLSWVCNGVSYDEYLRNGSGAPMRVMLTLALLQYVSADLVTGTSTAAGRASSKTAAASASKSKAKTYVVKPGDTLSEIAARHLGDWRRYDEIAELNGVRDPNKILAGATLRLP